MEQFTANKKPLFDSDIDPKRINKVADGLRRQGEFESARMLDGYADMLEAWEKAVPVATVENQFGFPIMGWIGDAGDKCPVGTKLYTHPSPADAERLECPSNLQEALCIIETAALRGVTLQGDDIPRLRATVDRIAPAQQPQDAERLAEALRHYCEQMETFQPQGELGAMHGAGMAFAYKDAAKTLRGLFAAHSAQAQPPAASVPDAETLRLHLGELTPDEVCVAKAAYRLALAAQENPNG